MTNYRATYGVVGGGEKMAQVNILQGFTQADSLKKTEAICGEDLSVQTVHQIPAEKKGSPSIHPSAQITSSLIRLTAQR